MNDALWERVTAAWDEIDRLDPLVAEVPGRAGSLAVHAEWWVMVQFEPPI